MKQRLQEIEEEAGALREMQAKVEKEMGATQGFVYTLRTHDFVIMMSTLVYIFNNLIIWRSISIGLGFCVVEIVCEVFAET